MRILEKIISAYAPLDCVGCGVEGRIACAECMDAMSYPAGQCYRCNAISSNNRTCSACRVVSDLVSANAAVIYQEATKDLVWRLKFSRAQAAADVMAQVMAERFGHMVSDDTLIVPVPTATKRVRGRGYDQAVLIARAFAARTGCRYASLLLRVGAQEQIGASKTQRREQLQGVFQLKHKYRDGGRVQGARILLIDDVMTTGATLEIAASTLIRNGAKVVGSLVFARA
jgi:ComF family protein